MKDLINHMDESIGILICQIYDIFTSEHLLLSMILQICLVSLLSRCAFVVGFVYLNIDMPIPAQRDTGKI